MKLSEPILIIGFGKTGESLAEFFHKRNLAFGVSEKNHELLGEISRYSPDYLELGEEREEFLDLFPLIIPSPGIVPQKFAHGKLLRSNTISELDLVQNYFDKDIIAVTGTNGKSTVTAFSGEIFKELKVPTFVGGNLGTPFSRILLSPDNYQMAVVEVSSYQLDYSRFFAPRVLIVTNLTIDHQERHGSMEEYRRVKFSPVERMKSIDYLIVNTQFREYVAEKEFAKKLNVYYFSAQDELLEKETGIYLKEGKFVFKGFFGERELFSVEKVKLQGAHNWENLMAGMLSAFVLGVDWNRLIPIAQNFSGIEHRLEKVDNPLNLEIYNDSKATNPDSTIVAVKAMKNDFILLLGGSPKDVSYKKLGEVISKSNCQEVVLVGDTALEIEGQISSMVIQSGKKIKRISDWDEAIEYCFKIAQKKNWAFLFSPACASFDRFKNFEDRGNYFKEKIALLADEKK